MIVYEHTTRGFQTKMNKWKSFFYISALLLIVIPTMMVIVTDVPFSSMFSNSVISTSIILLIIGQSMTIDENRKQAKNVAPNIGIIIALTLVLIVRFI